MSGEWGRARLTRDKARRLALRALKAPRSGSLYYEFVTSHDAPSVVSELAYWCAWERRSSLRRDYETRLASVEIDECTRAVLPHLASVQPVLLRLSAHERRLGIRWARAPLLLAILGGDLLTETRFCYRYSLAFVVLDREETVAEWEGDLVPWSPILNTSYSRGRV